VGTVQTSHLWYSVAFSTAFNSPPIVLTQCQTLNGGQAVVTRQRQGTSSGFQVRLQEEEGNDGTHAVETLGYVAVAP